MLLAKSMVILEKLEVTYGTDPVPAHGDALLAQNISITPFAGGTKDRNRARADFGNDPMVHVGKYTTLQYDIELAGSGAAGTAPLFGPSLRSCDVLETITGGTRVDYTTQNFNPATSKSSTIKYNWGGYQWSVLGARGDVSVIMNANDIPVMRFTKTGLFAASGADTALLDVKSDINAFIPAVEVNKANTTFSLWGATSTLQSAQMNLGNKVQFRDRPNTAIVSIINRQPDGSVSFEMDAVATKDWMGLAAADNLDTLSIVHGATAGNIATFTSSKTQLIQPSVQEVDGIIHVNANMRMVAPTASTEWRLRFT